MVTNGLQDSESMAAQSGLAAIVYWKKHLLPFPNTQGMKTNK